jgi:23S rRNA pseudouridine1911/1915/1917 synthase
MKQKLPFSILYEDPFLIGVNKAPGIAVSADRWDDSRERLDKLLGCRVFIVHRIDRDTSGLVIFAKDAETHRTLSKSFESREVQKTYIAVIHGRPSWTETDCDLALVPDGDKQHRTIVDIYRGKKSLTNFRFLGSAGNYSVVAAFPASGRTHQIRVHLAALGHPVVCDPLYGRSSPKPVLLSSIKKGWRGDPLNEKPLLARLGLHAAKLVLPAYRPADNDPGDGGPKDAGIADRGTDDFCLSAPLPRDMTALISQMEKCTGKDFGVGAIKEMPLT